MATTSELRQRTKELLGLANTDPATESGSPSNSEINSLLTEARRFVWGELTHLYPERAKTTTTVTYTASAESVSLALTHAAQLIQEVMACPPGQTARSHAYLLEALQPGEFPLYDRTGSPRFYFVEGGSIRLRPIPTQAVTLHVSYAPDITVGADGASITDIPSSYQHLYAYWAAAQYKALAGDPDAPVVERQFERIYDSLLKHYERQSPDQGFASYRPRRW